MAVLVTGATGFLGSHLCRALVAAGADVVATGRNPALLAKLGLRSIALDLSHPVASADIDRIGPLYAVVHCAGLSSPWGSPTAFRAANVAATKHLVDLAAVTGVKRCVMISTASVYFRFADQDDLRENHPLPPPVNDYARTKLQAEQVMLQRPDIGPVVLRPRGIYGAGDTALLPRLLRVARHRPLPRFARAGSTDITHVDDVVAAILVALDAGPEITGEVINITGGLGLTLPDIITAACDLTGVKPRWRKMPFRPALAVVRTLEAVAKRLPGQPEPPVTAYALGILHYRQTLDISKAARLLGWSPQVSFVEGLHRTFKDGAMRPGVL